MSAMLTVASIFVAAACSNSSSGASGGGAASSKDSTPIVSQSKALVQKYYDGTNKEPSGTPVAAQRGKKVYVISCGQNIGTCSQTAAGATSAGKLLDWNVTLLDGKGNPSTTASLVDQALAGGAQGIVIVGFDCSLAQASLQRAKASGVPVALVYGADCNAPYSSGESAGPSLVNEVSFADYPTGPEFLVGWGQARAQYAIANSNGNAHVLSFEYAESPATYAISRAFDSEIKKCPNCSVDVVKFATGDFGPGLQQLAQQAPLKFPDANAVMTPNDALYLAGIQAGIAASGRADKLFVVGGEGQAPVLDMVAKGAVDGVMAYSTDWAGFAAADTLNSVFAGQAPRNSGIGWQLIDKDHSSPIVGGTYKPSVDYVAAYKKLWGLG
jgi:ribose transport system substrate-binding protein